MGDPPLSAANNPGFAVGMYDANAPVLLRCCCGRPQCAFLDHSNSILDKLEHDLRAAAHIGQALLERHEAHLAASESERREMLANIQALETDKKRLEDDNTTIIDENRRLLGQLEDLNQTAAESDAQVEAISATLHETKSELQRLTILSDRALQLEAQLTDLEAEQADLRTQVSTCEEQSRCAVWRWKKAELTVAQLHNQIDAIEKDAREERERHVEVVGRLEGRRLAESEATSRTARLKASAPSRSLQQQASTNVVSHFVKDILRDNADLRVAVTDLRQMLYGSHDEVEQLREQLLDHQPMLPQTSDISSELHVHHHFHSPEKTIRKPRKKRIALSVSHFASPTDSGSSTPRSSRIREWSEQDAPAAPIASLVSPDGRHSHAKRPSAQSVESQTTLPSSSMAGSPLRGSSIFDSIDRTLDNSRPTSPNSSMPGSPPSSVFESGRQQTLSSGLLSSPSAVEKANHDTSHASEMANSDASADSESLLAKPTLATDRTSINTTLGIPDTATPKTAIPCEVSHGTHSAPNNEENSFASELEARRLRRRSCDSLLSVAGMDIHTLQGQPLQVFSGRGFSPRVASFPAAPAAATTCATASVAPVGATAAVTVPSSRNSESVQQVLLAQKRSCSGPKPIRTAKLGSWAWNRWTASPASALASASVLTSPATATASPLEHCFRSPGVNQAGVIKGLPPPKATPSAVEAVSVDEDLLKMTLAGE